MHRIEKGDMGCFIGGVFELAALVDVRLFDTETVTLARHLALTRDRVALLPKAVRKSLKTVKGDF